MSRLKRSTSLRCRRHCRPALDSPAVVRPPAARRRRGRRRGGDEKWSRSVIARIARRRRKNSSLSLLLLLLLLRKRELLLSGRDWRRRKMIEFQPPRPPREKLPTRRAAPLIASAGGQACRRLLHVQQPSGVNKRRWLPVPWLLLLKLLLLICAASAGQSSALVQVPNRHTLAYIPGDLVIGILVPVHERPSPKQAQTRTCGAVREQYGIQRVEAAFRTIDSINADPYILPNITLGIEIRDSCWHSPIALEQSIEFIRDAMAASEQSQAKLPVTAPGLGVGGGGGAGTVASPSPAGDAATAAAAATLGNATTNSLCAPLLLRQQQQQQQQQLKKVKNIVGVVGPASSTDTVQVQNLLQLFNMPQVGYSATSRDLSNKNFFKYFLRVVPSDKLQAQVMIDLMLAHNWTYITVAYTEGSYGSSLMNAFRERAQEVGICFATLESMPPNADDAKFDELIEAIQKHPNARVVICMCEGRTLGKLFSGFKRKNIINEYLVVGSDGWSDRFDVVEKQEEYALGGISIRIHSAYVYDFDDYYFALNPFTNHRNPWFAEFWETRFQCNLELAAAAASGQQQGGGAANQIRASAASSPLNTSGQQLQQQPRPFVRPPGAKLYNRTCTGRESLRNNHKQDAKMAFVQKSIITMALGLDSMQRAICPPNKPGLCPEMLPVNGSILLQHLMNVSFSFLDEEVYFDEQGDPPGKYEILNFQRRRPAAADDSQSGEPSEGGREPGAGGSGADPASSLSRPDGELDQWGPPEQTASPDSSVADKRRLIPLYDSYSTLKVYRRHGPSHSSGVSTANASTQTDGGPTTTTTTTTTTTATMGGGGRRAATKRQAPVADKQQQEPQQPLHPPASGYSSTSGYEYLHVGSWKSSDGLSLFGDIRWPSRAGREQQMMMGHGGADSGSSASSDSSVVTVGSSSSATDHRHHLSAGVLPKSVCSLPCAKGHAKKIQSDSVKCCWVCVPCRPHEYLFNEFKCKACEKGWWPNSIRTGCDQIPIHYLDWRSMEALTAISIAVFGLILTLATAIVFIRHNNTPVVKSTTRELSYMILFAMILCYANTFFLVAKPRRETCFVTRILPGFAFAMMYGALVTKTNRIARILAGSKKKIITRRPRFMSATSQVAITWLIVLMECLIIVFMLIREPADKMHDYPSDERVRLVCNTTTMGIIVPLGFDFFLIAMCTLYAFKTRNVPENFNEAKFIGFTMYTTLVIWIAFVAIYLSSDHKVTTLCLCISFSALFALFLLFFPRCYIIIFKPEKNNRSYFTTTKNVRCHIGYKIGSAGAAAAAAAASQAHHQLVGPYNTVTATSHGSNTSNTTTTNNNNNYYCNYQPGSAGTPSCYATGAGTLAATASSSLDLDQQQQPQQQYTDSPALQHQHSGQWSAGSRQQQQQELSRGRASGLQWRTEHERATVASVADLWLRGRGDASPAGGGLAAVAPGPVGGEQGLPSPSAAAALGGGAAADRPAAATLVRSLVGAIFSAFARRSRRKESDKVSSIQQHLRAIRHAENLDRQTHFRRSQVQRLAQRFDSSSGNYQLAELNGASGSNHWPVCIATRNSHHLAAAANNQFFRAGCLESIGGGGGGGAGSSKQVEATSERLLVILSQLIGAQNVWRLAETLRRYCQAREVAAAAAAATASAAAASPGDSRRSPELVLTAVELAANNGSASSGAGAKAVATTAATTPTMQLDLNKLADRKMALTLLRLLAELVRKSMFELRDQRAGMQSAATAVVAAVPTGALLAGNEMASHHGAAELAAANNEETGGVDDGGGDNDDAASNESVWSLASGPIVASDTAAAETTTNVVGVCKSGPAANCKPGSVPTARDSGGGAAAAAAESSAYRHHSGRQLVGRRIKPPPLAALSRRLDDDDGAGQPISQRNQQLSSDKTTAVATTTTTTTTTNTKSYNRGGGSSSSNDDGGAGGAQRNDDHDNNNLSYRNQVGNNQRKQQQRRQQTGAADTNEQTLQAAGTTASCATNSVTDDRYTLRTTTTTTTTTTSNGTRQSDGGAGSSSNNDEDPIKRALDCIMGAPRTWISGGSGRVSPVAPASASRSVSGNEPCAASNGPPSNFQPTRERARRSHHAASCGYQHRHHHHCHHHQRHHSSAGTASGSGAAAAEVAASGGTCCSGGSGGAIDGNEHVRLRGVSGGDSGYYIGSGDDKADASQIDATKPGECAAAPSRRPIRAGLTAPPTQHHHQVGESSYVPPGVAAASHKGPTAPSARSNLTTSACDQRNNTAAATTTPNGQSGGSSSSSSATKMPCQLAPHEITKPSGATRELAAAEPSGSQVNARQSISYVPPDIMAANNPELLKCGRHRRRTTSPTLKGHTNETEARPSPPPPTTTTIMTCAAAENSVAGGASLEHSGEQRRHKTGNCVTCLAELQAAGGGAAAQSNPQQQIGPTLPHQLAGQGRQHRHHCRRAARLCSATTTTGAPSPPKVAATVGNLDIAAGGGPLICFCCDKPECCVQPPAVAGSGSQHHRRHRHKSAASNCGSRSRSRSATRRSQAGAARPEGQIAASRPLQLSRSCNDCRRPSPAPCSLAEPELTIVDANDDAKL